MLGVTIQVAPIFYPKIAQISSHFGLWIVIATIVFMWTNHIALSEHTNCV